MQLCKIKIQKEAEKNYFIIKIKKKKLYSHQKAFENLLKLFSVTTSTVKYK